MKRAKKGRVGIKLLSKAVGLYIYSLFVRTQTTLKYPICRVTLNRARIEPTF